MPLLYGMKKNLILITSLILGILTIIISHKGIPLLPELAMIIAFFLIVKNRHSIAVFFNFKSIPEIFTIIISLLPFMIFEENINCFPVEAGGCQLIHVTYPFLILAVITIYIIVKIFKLKNFWSIITLFSGLGVIWETTVGISASAFWALPPFWILLFTVWIWLSYAILFLIPVTLQLDRNKN